MKPTKGRTLYVVTEESSLSFGLLFPLASSGAWGQSQPQAQDSTPLLHRIEAIRKELVSLPQYGVFDNLHFALQGNTVILRGEASQLTLKSAAENAVKKVEGVQTVVNEI